ncbi:AT-rich interaction domain hat-trick isoform X3 [Lycorma delicatula]|uniref:AT-rich interaction domain hat-trick isoform X3 n=1 Tax=Lycorma delicatula TaxID=130591 RepID=UPI003F518B51
MQRWNSKREMMGDDPPYLAVGTEVSAKYKGAFCEAKVRKVVRSVKCKVTFKLGLGTATVTDDQIRGTLRAGVVVEAKHPEKKEYAEATITKIQDCSQYTVVFDDGDITTLRRTALCLKSGRHFAESETLDQLPLTHPEHFGNPVIGGRRGRRNRQDDSSDDEELIKKGKHRREEKEADIGKVVCVEISEKKKQKDNWFPGLVVAPTAQDTVRIHVREEYLVRSFKDGRYYTVPKKEATPFTREIGSKVDNNTLRTAVEKALLFLDRDELPPHWDRELLFGLDETSNSDSDAALDSDTSDDEPREEKDHFVAQLYKFMDDRGTPINKGPTIATKDVDLYKLFKVVHKLGGYNRVTNHNQWKTISHKLGFGQTAATVNLVKHAYKKFLHSFEDFYRKLGCTMVNHPRNNRARHRSNRSLIRDRDRALVNKEKANDKDATDDVKEVPTIDVKKEEPVKKKEEEEKSKEPLETQKSLRDNRKETQKNKSKDDKIEKKDDKVVVKEQQPCKKTENEVVSVKSKDIKIDEREDRIKMRDSVKAMDSASNLKVEGRQEKDLPKSRKDKDAANKESEEKDIQKVKVNKKDSKELKAKQEEKEEIKSNNKNEKDSVNRTLGKKLVTIEVENICSVNTYSASGNSGGMGSSAESVPNNPKVKKRSIFSKVTGTNKKKQSPDKVPKVKKVLGLSTTRQKRSLKDRVKAIVKKFKLKSNNNCSNSNNNSTNNKKETKNLCELPAAAPVAVTHPTRPHPSVSSTSSLPLPTQSSVTATIKAVVGKDEKKKVICNQNSTNDDSKPHDGSSSDDCNNVCKDDVTIDDEIVGTNDDEGKEEDVYVQNQFESENSSNRDVTGECEQTQIPLIVLTATTVKAKPNITMGTSVIIDGANSSKNVQLTRSKSKEEAPIKVKKVEQNTETRKSIATSISSTTLPTTTCTQSATTNTTAMSSSLSLPLLSSPPSSVASTTGSGPTSSGSPQSQPPGTPSETEKKRGRKRKEDEKGNGSEEVLDQLPSYKSVSVGDKLKVYYGPTHESKVTYEAKVLSSKEEGSETLYLVHYTGWNTRYDEWIKRSRIADNLSWSPGRIKRNRLQHQQQQLEKSTYDNLLYVQLTKQSTTGGKRNRGSEGMNSGSSVSMMVKRSTTPSSTRTPPSHATRTYTRTKQRTRRTSGHTDLSESESDEEYESDSDAEISCGSAQKRNEKQVCSSDEKEENSDFSRSKRRMSCLQSPSSDEKGKDDTNSAKRKLVSSCSVSEDEKEGIRKIADSKPQDNKLQEKRAITRSSTEKEIRYSDEFPSSTSTNPERLRGRKLRSDKASQILSESEDEKDELQEQVIKKELRRTFNDKRKNDDNNLKAKICENKKDSVLYEEDEDIKLAHVQRKESSSKPNSEHENFSRDVGQVSSKNRDKRKSDSCSLLKSPLESEDNEKESKPEAVKDFKDEDCLPRSDRLRNRIEKKKSTFEAKASFSTNLPTIDKVIIDDETLNKTGEKNQNTVVNSFIDECLKIQSIDEQVPEISIKEEISVNKNDVDSIEAVVLNQDSAGSDSRRKIKNDKRKPAGGGSLQLSEKSNNEFASVKEESPQEGDRRRSRRLPSAIRKDEITVIKNMVPKVEPEDEQPKGRDFDLIQIRSELKGIEKAVKVPPVDPTGSSESTQNFDIKDINTSIEEAIDIKVKQEDDSPIKEADSPADDIYEFKEPEPFEFEVRQKCSDEKGVKMQRRPFGRVCDDLSKNIPIIRRRKPEVPSLIPDSRKRFRRGFVKKKEDTHTSPKSDDNTTKNNLDTILPLTSPEPKTAPLKAYANIVSPTCDSPKPLQIVDVPEKPQKESVTSSGKQPLSSDEIVKSENIKHFTEISDETEPLDDDSEDRLVISENEDTEIDLDKSNLLPDLQKESCSSVQFSVCHTTMTKTTDCFSSPLSLPSSNSAPSLPLSTSDLSVDQNSKEPAINFADVSVIKKNKSESNQVTKEESIEIKEVVEEDEEEELEDDAISAAIQRVILQTITDDESNDIDLITPPLVVSKPIQSQIPLSPSRAPSYSQSPTRREGTGRRRKTTLSKEFIEDTDSDSDSDDRVIKIKTSNILTMNPLPVAIGPQNFIKIEPRKEIVLSPVIVAAVVPSFTLNVEDASMATSQKPLAIFSSSTSLSSKEDTHITTSLNTEDSEISVIVDIDGDNEICDKENKNNYGDNEEEKKVDNSGQDDIINKNEKSPVSEMKDDESVGVVAGGDNDNHCNDVPVENEIDDTSHPSVSVIQGPETNEPKNHECKEDEEVNTDRKEDVVEVMEENEGNSAKDKHLLKESEEEEEEIEEDAKNLAESVKEEVKNNVDNDETVEDVVVSTRNNEVAAEDGVEGGEEDNGGDESLEDSKKEQDRSPSDRSDIEEEESLVSEERTEMKEDECMQSLLCEETIPGSPAPPVQKDKELEGVDNGMTPNASTAAELPFASAPGTSLHTGAPAYTKPVTVQQPIQPPVQPPPEAAPVMDNTPPTTPESSLSPISNSPRGERSGSSPGLDNDSTKSHRDSSEIDLDGFPDHNKMENFSEEDSVCNIGMPGTTLLKKQPLSNGRLEQDSTPCKKRRRSRKRSEDASKRVKLARRSPRNPVGSDSDDTSENSLAGSSLDLPSSRSPKPSKYNFYVQLDPELDGAQRIAVLQQKLQELRKTYMALKAELACIDRRRKKLRRREREEKSSKQEVPCS